LGCTAWRITSSAGNEAGVGGELFQRFGVPFSMVLESSERPMTVRTLIVVLVCAGLAVPADGAVNWSQPGTQKFEVVEGEWRDAERGARSVLWKCYLPASTDKPCPVVIFSHGGGGSRDTNAMLGRHLASHGFAALHIQHEGSDLRAFRANPRSLRAVNDPRESEPRYRDMAFVVATLQDRDRIGVLKGRIDPARIGVSGHSYGGLTCQIAAGQVVNGYGQKLSVPALKGAFILSPSPPRESYGEAQSSFANMLMPMFSLTGTADIPPDRSFAAIERRIPFDQTANVDQWLLILDGATHFTFSGQETLPTVARRLPGMEPDPNLAEHHACIRAAALAFWRTVLQDDRDARKYLSEGEYANFVGKRGVVEFKAGRP
jgi:predicted dienelactone hydrolase